MVGAKVLMRKLWLDKLKWDEKLPQEYAHEWDKISADIHQLSNVSFNRKALSTDSNNSMFIFTDASKEAYGFAAYCVDNADNRSNLLFAKCKSAPIKSKSLPTLVLLFSI